MGSSDENRRRDYSTYKEIMDNVFGTTCMGYIEPSSSLGEEDPFVNCSNTSDSELGDPSDVEKDEENTEDDS